MVFKYTKILNTTVVACQKGLDKQCRPRSDCFLSGSSDKHFVSSSLREKCLNFENIYQSQFSSISTCCGFTLEASGQVTSFLDCKEMAPLKRQKDHLNKGPAFPISEWSLWISWIVLKLCCFTVYCLVVRNHFQIITYIIQ